MKLSLQFLIVILLAAPCVGQVAAQKSKPAGPPCSLDRQAGDWAAISLGKTNGADNMAVATYHLNKDGTSSAHIWANTGTVSVEFDRVGNTAVNENCTLVQTWNDGGPAAHCVIFDDGNEMWCIYDQPAFNQTNLKRIHTRN